MLDRYELLKAITEHVHANHEIAVFTVAYLAADIPVELLARLLDAIHELEDPVSYERFIRAFIERFGRAPGATR